MSSAVSPFTICRMFTDSGSRGSKKRTSPLTLWEGVVVMLGEHTGAPGCTTCNQGPSTHTIQGHGPWTLRVSREATGWHMGPPH